MTDKTDPLRAAAWDALDVLDRYEAESATADRLRAALSAPAAQPVQAPAPAPVVPAEPLIRFCPGCGSVGEVGTEYYDCCPDGIKARVIPERLAQHCHDLFQLALQGAAAPSVPDGWKLVPVEPTPEMLMHAERTIPPTFSIGDEYRAMVAAAPHPAGGAES